MIFKKFINLFRRKMIPKTKPRAILPEIYHSPSLLSPAVQPQGTTLAQRAKLGRVFGRQGGFQLSDFDFIQKSSYCHVLSLEDVDMFDLEGLEEHQSILVNSSVFKKNVYCC